ncbi:MAG: sigma-54-dependent Fis family transcriptional regulator, partial [Deltaproteobacteria bacterium]|nr:sigma-54-dependent Fis family transcriptional regulator [Deltaproteobacteria bacterium]
IAPIAYHFLKQCGEGMGKDIRGFESEAMGRLMEYDWPGNVRQLKNVIERAVILCDGGNISPRDLPVLEEGDTPRDYVPSTNEELKQIKKEIRQKAVREVEKRFILNALMENGWNVTRAARNVGLQRPNFQNLMRKYGIQLPTGPRPPGDKA